MTDRNENREPFDDAERGTARNRSCLRSFLGGDDDATASTHAPSDEGRDAHSHPHNDRDPEVSHRSEATTRIVNNTAREGDPPPRGEGDRREYERRWADFAKAYFTMGLIPLYIWMRERKQPSKPKTEEEKKREKEWCTTSLIATLGSICTIIALVLTLLAAFDVWPQKADDDPVQPVTSNVKALDLEYCLKCPSVCEEGVPANDVCAFICDDCRKAADDNRNPILLTLSVTKDDGSPVNDLEFSDFDLSGTAPPGAGFGICNKNLCLAALRGSGSTGAYDLVIHPAYFQDWGPNGHAGTVLVKRGDERGTVDFKVKLPRVHIPEDVLTERDSTTLLASYDTAICDHPSVKQCDGLNHTHKAASAENHNPICVSVLVARNGELVTNLTRAEFNFIPFTGPTPFHACPNETCPNNFFIDSYGIYKQFFDEKSSGTNWTAGSYSGAIKVFLDEDTSIFERVSFEIPETTPPIREIQTLEIWTPVVDTECASNHNQDVVRLYVFVAMGPSGQPVETIEADDFNIATVAAPLGEDGAEFRKCVDTEESGDDPFQSKDGLYMITLKYYGKYPEENWKRGDYLGRITATEDGLSGHALFQFSIPHYRDVKN